MDYGEVLGRAWKIIWRHKVLWIFGILAGCTGSGAGNPGSNVTYQSDLPASVQTIFDRFTTAQWAALIAAILAIILILIILAVFLNTVSRTAMIRGVRQAENGADRLAFGELFSGSLAYFWRVFGLYLLVGISLFIAILVLSAAAIIGVAVTLGLFLLCLFPLLCLLIPILWFITIVVEQSVNAIVVEDTGLFDGLRRGWQVTRNNLGAMIIMGLILILGISGLGGLILATPIFFFFIPFVIGAFSGDQQTIWTGMAVFGLCMLAYLPFLLLLNGILQSYVSSAWTLTYLRLTGRGPQASGSFEALPVEGQAG